MKSVSKPSVVGVQTAGAGVGARAVARGSVSMVGVTYTVVYDVTVRPSSVIVMDT